MADEKSVTYDAAYIDPETAEVLSQVIRGMLGGKPEDAVAQAITLCLAGAAPDKVLAVAHNTLDAAALALDDGDATPPRPEVAARIRRAMDVLMGRDVPAAERVAVKALERIANEAADALARAKG